MSCPTSGLQLLQLPGTPTTLLLQDLSVYTGPVGHPRLELTLPGRRSAYLIPITPSRTVVVRASDVGGYLPDGVYMAHYSIDPADTQQICYTFFRDEAFRCRLNAWIACIDWCRETPTSKNSQLLTRVSSLLLAIRAVIDTDPTKAADYYELAVSLLPH